MQDDLIEFRPPKGMVPEDIAVGDTFDLVSTYRLKGDQSVCLIQAGDFKLKGYDESEYAEHEKKDRREGYGNVMQSMHDAMGGNTDMGGGGGY